VSEEQNLSHLTKQPSKQEQPVKVIQEQSFGSHSSYWPFALAVALLVVLIGVIANTPIILGIGIVLIVAAVIGWGLEHR
jgi:hypothetical protein